MSKLVSVLNETGKGFYIVEKNQNIYSVANEFSTTVPLILQQNGKYLTEKRQFLYIEKQPKTYTITPTDTTESLQKKLGVTVEKLLKINGVKYLYPGLTVILTNE